MKWEWLHFYSLQKPKKYFRFTTVKTRRLARFSDVADLQFLQSWRHQETSFTSDSFSTTLEWAVFNISFFEKFYLKKIYISFLCSKQNNEWVFIKLLFAIICNIIIWSLLIKQYHQIIIKAKLIYIDDIKKIFQEGSRFKLRWQGLTGGPAVRPLAGPDNGGCYQEIFLNSSSTAPVQVTIVTKY